MSHPAVGHQVSSGPAPLPRIALRRAGPRRRRARGFTLIEIIVVVVIIGLLATLVVTNVLPMVEKARVTKAKADLRGLETALDQFYLDNSRFPTTEQGLKALVTQPTDDSIRHYREGGYLQRLQKDPWGRDYLYQYPGTHGQKYDLYTLGADGQEGGQGNDADIGNWNLGDD
jgi:general secretion pathway protein G